MITASKAKDSLHDHHTKGANTMNTRNTWISLLQQIAEPVLSAAAANQLAATLPTYLHEDKADYRCLEALGRTMCGIAPWLESDNVPACEQALQKQLRLLARRAIANATDPVAPDYMNFCKGAQPLVDAAFLAHGILRAPRQLWTSLEPQVQQNVIEALKSSRVITPFQNNWLLFAAMVEAALSMMGESVVTERVENAVQTFADKWYVGDGTYSDGEHFHFDYYNSFVIQPMYLDVIRAFPQYAHLVPEAMKRARRYSQIQERMIAPDGSYTIIGRSICYRFGAFQLLSQLALEQQLPEELPPAQVRCALTAVLNKCAEGGLFDEKGWLRPGIFGYQPELAERYINVGSLYLCCAVFLVLGLPEEAPFWADDDLPWTSRRIWSGERLLADHAID